MEDIRKIRKRKNKRKKIEKKPGMGEDIEPTPDDVSEAEKNY
jgi:hypothetical protein